jgi:TPR repeat protein
MAQNLPFTLEEAQLEIGRCHELGSGTAVDIAKAAELYRQAAAQGLAGAQFALGNLYYDGKGVWKDFAERRPPLRRQGRVA